MPVFFSQDGAGAQFVSEAGFMNRNMKILEYIPYASSPEQQKANRPNFGPEQSCRHCRLDIKHNDSRRQFLLIDKSL